MMTKADFIERFSAKGYTKVSCRQFIEDFWETVIECLNEDGELCFNGYCQFRVDEVAPQRRIHPRTGEEIFTKAKRRVKFSTGSQMKKELN